jgi:hypothetical protein
MEFSSANVPTLKYRTQYHSRFVDYIFCFLCDRLGFARQKVSGTDCHIYYGNSVPAGLSRQTIVIPVNAGAILWREVLDGRLPATNAGRSLPFDIVSAVGALLSDSVNSGRRHEALDQHGRLPYASSFQCEHEIGHLPVVDRYVQFLEQLLEDRWGLRGLPLWPPGKTHAIGLSHDVDRLNNRSARVRQVVVAALKETLRVRSNDRKAPAWFRHRYEYLKESPEGRREVDALRQVLQEEMKYGFRSTLFIAAVNLYGSYSGRFDVNYYCRSNVFRELYRELQADGFEIGLHASYNACQAQWRFYWERLKLGWATGRLPIGVRHHYWRLDAPSERTLAMHQAAGFRYDSSLAFNDAMAFRRSTASPFFPWSRGRQRPIRVLQLPVFCMDGNLFQRPSTTTDALQQITARTQIIKEAGGLGVVDWHSDTAHPDHPKYAQWGKCYFDYLNYLARDDGAWGTSLETIADWLTRRLRVLRAASRCR